MCAGLTIFPRPDIVYMWAAGRLSFPDLLPSSWNPLSWIPDRLANLWSGQGGEEEYAGLPLVDAETGPDRNGCFSPAEPSATLYEPPPQETTALLQDQRSPLDDES